MFGGGGGGGISPCNTHAHDAWLAHNERQEGFSGTCTLPAVQLGVGLGITSGLPCGVPSANSNRPACGYMGRGGR